MRARLGHLSLVFGFLRRGGLGFRGLAQALEILLRILQRWFELNRGLDFFLCFVAMTFFFEDLSEAPVRRPERRRTSFWRLGEIAPQKLLSERELIRSGSNKYELASLVLRCEVVGHSVLGLGEGRLEVGPTLLLHVENGQHV